MLGRGRSKPARGEGETTIFFATDLHGSEVCFRKFVAAAGFYGADLLVLGGDLTGKLVVLTFLDPVCTSDCPLIANQLAIADRELGSLAQQVEFVAIDTNPMFHFVSDVDAFTQSHGLGGFANWHFLCGAPDTVEGVLAAYGISVVVPAVGMIQHSEAMYFITADGRQAAYLDDGAGVQLTETYADQVRDEIRSLLK